MNRLLLYHILSLAGILISPEKLPAQQKVFTSDIDNFWGAYDSIKTTRDSARQIQLIQTLYIDKGTEGLKAFMAARNYSAALYIKLINSYPGFWNSIRPNTLAVKSKVNEIEKTITTLKKHYPGLKNAKMYFTIGGLRSGGTVKDSLVLIGAEIATGDAQTVTSELPNKWLAGVFKSQSADNLVSLNIHEYIHTQQTGESSNLLAQAIAEGSCDFIAELVTGKPLQRNYITYGHQHARELKAAFKTDMFSTAFNKWLYNGANAEAMADLGYFIGYDICKHYYRNAANKKQAVKEIIELNYSDTTAVENFLRASGYFKEGFDKVQLMRSFRDKQPQLITTRPFQHGDTLVDASLNQMTLVFSRPMSKGFSINYGEKGKEFYPVTNIIGLSDDKTKLTIGLNLQPNHEYGLIVTDRSFTSTEGYPLLKDYPIAFRTKP